MSAGEISWVRALRGPVILITLGVLFLLDNFTPYGFGQTWPVLLIVFGALSLVGRGAAPAGPYSFPPSAPPPPPAGPGYRQSPYPSDKSPGGAS